IKVASKKKKKQVTAKRKSIRLPIIEVMIQLRARIRLAQRHLRQLAWYRNPSGTMGRFVTECEAIVAADPVYRARFGLEFHRRDAAVGVECSYSTKERVYCTLLRKECIGDIISKSRPIIRRRQARQGRRGKEAMANPEVLAKLTMTPEQHRSCMEIIRKGDLDV
ncbi:unnamed protein product, partial [Aureobasidium pullulans]